MNANELAEIIEHLENANYMGASKAATMLRQQQAEIEELEKENTDLRYLIATKLEQQDEQFEKGFKAGKEEGWKAHKFHHPVKEQDESFDRTASHMAGEYVSYPVKEQDTDCQYCKQGCIRCDARKQLTDEEIEKIAEEFKDVDYTLDDEEAFDVFNHRGFARAILRKAQEK